MLLLGKALDIFNALSCAPYITNTNRYHSVTN